MGQFRIRTLFFLVTISVFTVLAYMQFRPLPPSEKPPVYDRVITESEVIGISKWLVSQNEPWSAHDATYEVHTDNEGWAIIVWRLPKTPGGSRHIELDNYGQMTSYLRCP